MKIFIVVTKDKSNAALVNYRDTSPISVHEFTYPDEVLYQLCYEFPSVDFTELPEPLQSGDMFAFSNDNRNHWYQIA